MRKIMMAAAVAATMAAAPAAAQVQVAGGLVTVQIGDISVLNDSLNQNDVRILEDFLNNNNTPLNAQLPITVQVPVGIAANVCPNVSNVAILGMAGGNAADIDCTATNASRALSSSIVRAITSQQQ